MSLEYNYQILLQKHSKLINVLRTTRLIVAFEFDNDYLPHQIPKGKAHSKYTKFQEYTCHMILTSRWI